MLRRSLLPPLFLLVSASWLTIWCSEPLMATSYYVDFADGADTNAGTSPRAPLKHVPGDPRATEVAASVELAPGDTVVLRGGVVYYGTIELKNSGEPERPITLDGNTAGTFGQGRAIIDGSRPLTDWRRCETPEAAGGNPRYRDICFADIPKPASWRSLNLCDREKPLPIAQDPNPADPFFQERVGEFHRTDEAMVSSYPGKVYFEPGSRGNAVTPLIGIILGQPTVVEPIQGGAFTVELKQPVEISAIGVKQHPRYVPIREMAFLADGKEMLQFELKRDHPDMQRFELPAPVKVRKFTFKLRSAHPGFDAAWTKLSQVAAFDAEGHNVLADEVLTVITDQERFAGKDANYYDGMWVGFHAGNNAINYRQVRRFEPSRSQLLIENYGGKLYQDTKYALYNSVKLIDVPGEYSVEPTDDPGVWRVFLLPDRLVDGHPAGIGYSVASTGIQLDGVSHVRVDGFLIRRQGGSRASGINVTSCRDVRCSDCEVTLVDGSVGISATFTDGIVAENCYVHHCPGHTKGLVFRSCKNVGTRGCRFVKNTSTALDYYGCEGGDCRENLVTDHYGMHANGLTFYLGCKDIVIERNEVYDSNVCLTIQQAENIVIRNNILDAGDRTLCVGIWTATPLRNVQFLNNHLVRSFKEDQWQAAVFSNNGGPEGLVFRNNIIDGLSGNLPGTYEHNIYTRWGPNQGDHRLGKGEVYEPNLGNLFVDPNARDFRPRPDSPAIDAGMDVGVKEDFNGTPRPAGKVVDIGAYELKTR